MTGLNIQLVLLGTGTPNAEPDRSGPSVAIVVNERSYIVDFGAGIVRRAASAYQNGIQGLAPEKLCLAFLTHLHSDHTIGYPDLILTPWVLDRKVPLEVFGPPGLKSLTEHIIAAYQEDIHERLTGLEPANPNGCQVKAIEIKPGLVYRDDLVEVEAFPACHGSWQAFSYRFTIDHRFAIVVSGDTAPYPDMAKRYANCHLLVHEVYSYKGWLGRSPEWQQYHASVHTSTKELAEAAREAQPERLILYHQLFFGQSEAGLLQEICELYDGAVVSGKDLDVFHLPNQV